MRCIRLESLAGYFWIMCLEPCTLVGNAAMVVKTITSQAWTSNVVLALMDGFLDSGYELYMDNHYNSVGLAKNFTSKSTYVCGTLTFDRKGNLKNLVKKKLNQGDSEWLRSVSIMVNKWKDKRNVLTISNMHKGEMVQVQNKNGKISTKPDTVRDYTLGMAGIDRSDQPVSYYSFHRKLYYITWKSSCTMHTCFTTKEIERIKG
uniref:PiggyBac transposable element-derived protein domain-containing protein n=1 Tax=Glossina palpalis gambiensis TaxID=67801 RepID=A0A1B0BXL7_9MUSC